MIHDQASMEWFWGDRLMMAAGWVAETDGRICGFCVRDQDTVIALYLSPEARGKGIGRALLSLAQEGCNVLRLKVFVANAMAQRFYGRQGFQEIARSAGDNEEGLPDIEMRWQCIS